MKRIFTFLFATMFAGQAWAQTTFWIDDCPSGGWVGDTLLPKEIKIYEVKEEIKPHYLAEQQNMFNHQKLKRSDNELNM